jgi:hypothetical protein
MPLDQVLVIKATNQPMGYSFVGIDSDRGSVWDASKSAYGTTISAASFALGGSENGSLHYLVEPSEGELGQEGTPGEEQGRLSMLASLPCPYESLRSGRYRGKMDHSRSNQ